MTRCSMVIKRYIPTTDTQTQTHLSPSKLTAYKQAVPVRKVLWTRAESRRTKILSRQLSKKSSQTNSKTTKWSALVLEITPKTICELKPNLSLCSKSEPWTIKLQSKRTRLRRLSLNNRSSSSLVTLPFLVRAILKLFWILTVQKFQFHSTPSNK